MNAKNPKLTIKHLLTHYYYTLLQIVFVIFEHYLISAYFVSNEITPRFWYHTYVVYLY